MEKAWKDMSLAERRDSRLTQWRQSAEKLEFVDPEAKALFQASVTRTMEAIKLEKEPDRVPICPMYTFLPADLYGVSTKEVLYDPRRLTEIWKRFMLDYRPDYYSTPLLVTYGPALERLDYRLYKWPGHGIKEKYPYQCVEKEYMTVEEYPALINDPTDFWLRTYLPRICGALEALTNLAPLTGMIELPAMPPSLITLGLPPVQEAFEALLDASRQTFEWAGVIGAYDAEIQGLGFPGSFGSFTKAPFDVIGDTLRGSHGIMMDMYRVPDLLLKALESITPIYINMGVGGEMASGNPLVFIPLHKGADGFMSDQQFKTFYWPGLKAVIVGLIEAGCVPMLFAEGGYNTRLEYLNELPQGHCIWIFDQTDMATAKKVIGQTTCIGGNVPSSLIISGTAGDVKACCQNLIDTAAPGGGYIMANGCALDEGKPETIHAMIDFTREYGVYKK